MLLHKIKGITAVFMISLLFTLVAFNLRYQLQLQDTSAKQVQYILDAGHGIPDGGTSGVDGTTEQELNLAIALKVSDALKDRDIPHLMTRSDENSIYREGNTIHDKKVSDIRHRIEIAGEVPSAPLISIHMNSYPDPLVHGIQVFYKASDARSKQIAEALQLSFNTELQPDNTKTVKTISKNIYLFSHVENPAVLIECGFLSNKEDLKALQDSGYQEKLSQIIAMVLSASE